MPSSVECCNESLDGSEYSGRFLDITKKEDEITGEKMEEEEELVV